MLLNLESLPTKSYVVVNSFALKVGGGRTVLLSFYAEAIKSHLDYVIFAPVGSGLLSTENVFVFEIGIDSWLKRIAWDFFYLNYLLKKSKIEPSLIVSLQNTSINTKTRQLVFIHQSIPFTKVKINIFYTKLFFYKYFYKFFIKRFLKDDSVIVVQTEWMKIAVSRIVPKNTIFVCNPDLEYISRLIEDSLSSANGKVINLHENSSTIFFYPAAPYFYKNHEVLIRAVKQLTLLGEENFRVLFTFKESESIYLKKLTKDLQVEQFIDFIGELSFNEMSHYYRFSDAVVFPSYIETYGLPLSEAAAFGKRILASNCDYSKEVLAEYDGCIFISYDDVCAWAKGIKSVLDSKLSFKPLKPATNTKTVIKIIKDIVNAQ